MAKKDRDRKADKVFDAHHDVEEKVAPADESREPAAGLIGNGEMVDPRLIAPR